MHEQIFFSGKCHVAKFASKLACGVLTRPLVSIEPPFPVGLEGALLAVIVVPVPLVVEGQLGLVKTALPGPVTLVQVLSQFQLASTDKTAACHEAKASARVRSSKHDLHRLYAMPLFCCVTLYVLR